MGQVRWRLIRKDHYILSPNEFKQALLVSQLAIIFIVAQVCFTLLDILNGYWIPLPYLSISIVLGFISLWLNYKGKFLTAKIILAVATNLIAIFFTAILNKDLGIYLFSISINIGIMAVFGQHHLRYAIPIIIVSSLAFLAAMFHPYQRLPIPDEPHYITQNLTWSFLIANAASITIVFYFVKANNKSEDTLMKKENDLILRNRELGKVNAELDKFFYSASHDMRAPLTSIQGLIQLMEMSKDMPELKQYTQHLKERAANLQQFIAKITEYASNGRKEIVLESLHLKPIIREAIETLRFYPNAEKIKVQMEVPDHLLLMSDSLRLQIIFSNLLSNAIKYHDLRKPSPFIRIAAKETPGLVIITIEDNGEGMREENLKNIFGMFYRAHRQVQGTGLGLFIVKEALEKIGGDITVTSEYGAGTEFAILLPQLPKVVG